MDMENVTDLILWKEYKRRPGRVTAHQWRWNKEYAKNRQLDPLQILHSNSVKIGTMHCDDGEQISIKDREWVVVNSEGYIDIINHEMFRSLYREVKDGQPKRN